jgi:hypothetical protein
VYTFEELLLQLSLGDLNLHGFVDLLRMPALVVGIVLDGRREQSVDERRLAQTRFSRNLMTGRKQSVICSTGLFSWWTFFAHHNSEGCTALRYNLVPTPGVSIEAISEEADAFSSPYL